MTPNKKLIEVALPLEAINKACAREKSIRHGHPSTLHLWWARRPLAAARAVIFAQMVDDPSALPDLFPTVKKQEKERERLFRIIEDLVQWENTSNETVLQAARDEIWQSWRRACAQNADHPRAKDIFDRNRLPAFHDPFAGGGSLPLEAQRLGLESHASDLNPVAVLINKALIEIPPKFSGKPPVNPEARNDQSLIAREWKGAQGLAEDVRYYGQWMRDEAEKRIGHLYPKVEVTAQMVKSRPDLKPYVGQGLTVIGWLWARTVASPNPALGGVHVPLTSSFWLSTKLRQQSWLEPIRAPDGRSYRFEIRTGIPKDEAAIDAGTKTGRGGNFGCLLSGVPIPAEYVRAEGVAGRLGATMLAMVAAGQRQRIYLPATERDLAVARSAVPEWVPDFEFVRSSRYMTPYVYGLDTFAKLFLPRQLVALECFAALVPEARERCLQDARTAGVATPSEVADAVAAYTLLALGRLVNRSSSLCFWDNGPGKIQQVFARQALSMTWDFCEGNPFSDSSGNFVGQLDYLTKVIAASPVHVRGGEAHSADARQALGRDIIVSMDPPYYDNVPYADLADFFYVWMRRAGGSLFPDLFSTLLVPKQQELVMDPIRHGGEKASEQCFTEGMAEVLRRVAEAQIATVPAAIYYAFRQGETSEEGVSSTGWETFLAGVVDAGLAVTATWPIRTELIGNLKKQKNALASSIVLACRPRANNAPTATRREFVAALRAELPQALAHLQRGNIAPVDLAQAAIGPGMAVYTRYAKVLDAEGKSLTVREALALINQTLDVVLAEQEGDFDADSRWALAWFEQSGFADGAYGVAETLSKAKNTSVAGLVEAGILTSIRGKVRLLKPSELSTDWDPATDGRLTTWEMVHHLIHTLEVSGESGASALAAKLGTKAEGARTLCYRLYTLCERNKRATEALAYNGLVQSWPEIIRLAREGGKPRTEQTTLFNENEA